MNPRAKIVAVTLLLGVALAAGFFLMRMCVPAKPVPSTEVGLAWLKSEYHLSDAQFQRIEAVHDAYYPQCKEMCRHIAAANKKVTTLLQSANTMTPELEAALQQAEAVHTDCRTATLKHIFAVASLMPPPEARRYLHDTAPRVLGAYHSVDDVMSEPSDHAKP